MKPRIKAAKRILFALIALIICLILAILSWYQLVRLTVEHASTDKLEDLPVRKVALVLGTTSKLQDGTPNPFFEHRMDAAAELYKAGKAKTLFVSGYGGPYYSENRDMTNALIERGVPRSSIKSDPHGYRTLDSVLRAHDVFHLNSFTIVSQAFHNHRALYICREHGIDASAYEAKGVSEIDLWLISLGREHLARVKMAADLYLLDTKPKLTQADQSPAATSLAK